MASGCFSRRWAARKTSSWWIPTWRWRATRLDARLKTKVHVKAGPHDVAVAFLRRDSAESDEPLQPFTRDLDLQNMNGIPLIDHVQITGPFDATGPGRHAEPAADFRLHIRRVPRTKFRARRRFSRRWRAGLIGGR